jgi:hypothetical protein
LILQALYTVLGLCLFFADSAGANPDKSIDNSKLSAAVGPAVTPSETIFATSYFNLGIGKNFPVDKGTRRFQPGYYHPIFGYRYVLNDSWLMGVSTQFKVLKARETGEPVSLFCIEEQSQKIFRLYHPFYLLMGGKFMYLLPANKPRFPVQKNSDFAIEIGAGATISLLYMINKSTFIGAYLDQWRGTKTTRLQALESGFFVSVKSVTEDR